MLWVSKKKNWLLYERGTKNLKCYRLVEKRWGGHSHSLQVSYYVNDYPHADCWGSLPLRTLQAKTNQLFLSIFEWLHFFITLYGVGPLSFCNVPYFLYFFFFLYIFVSFCRLLNFLVSRVWISCLKETTMSSYEEPSPKKLYKPHIFIYSFPLL